jgi:hypothetical protein
MKKKNEKTSDYSLAHVLYQRLGNDWYAFTEVDGDCFMTKVDAAVMQSKDKKVVESKKAPKAA